MIVCVLNASAILLTHMQRNVDDGSTSAAAEDHVRLKEGALWRVRKDVYAPIICRVVSATAAGQRFA